MIKRVAIVCAIVASFHSTCVADSMDVKFDKLLESALSIPTRDSGGGQDAWLAPRIFCWNVAGHPDVGNEFEREKNKKIAQEKKHEIRKHIYQVTLESKLQEYDFQTLRFPISAVHEEMAGEEHVIFTNKIRFKGVHMDKEGAQTLISRLDEDRIIKGLALVHLNNAKCNQEPELGGFDYL